MFMFDYFKELITTTIPDPANSDDTSDILDQADWEDHFGSSLRVYERKHPFPGLLINYVENKEAVIIPRMLSLKCLNLASRKHIRTEALMPFRVRGLIAT